MCDVNTGLNKMINLEAKLSERLIGNLLFMSDVQTCTLFTMSGNSFLKEKLLSLVSYWSQLTTDNKQPLCVCVCFYRMKELTVFCQLYSYVAVNRGTVINSKVK